MHFRFWQHPLLDPRRLIFGEARGWRRTVLGIAVLVLVFPLARWIALFCLLALALLAARVVYVASEDTPEEKEHKRWVCSASDDVYLYPWDRDLKKTCPKHHPLRPERPE